VHEKFTQGLMSTNGSSQKEFSEYFTREYISLPFEKCIKLFSERKYDSPEMISLLHIHKAEKVSTHGLIDCFSFLD